MFTSFQSKPKFLTLKLMSRRSRSWLKLVLLDRASVRACAPVLHKVANSVLRRPISRVQSLRKWRQLSNEPKKVMLRRMDKILRRHHTQSE